MLMWQFWLIVAGIFFIGEIFTAGFLVFWVGLGAILAMITSFFTDSLIIQTAVFVVSSGLLLFLTRPFVNKYVAKDQDDVVTNAKSIIGRKAIVTEDIDENTVGEVKVDGKRWSAVSDTEIKLNEKAKILAIDGVKLKCQRVEEKN